MTGYDGTSYFKSGRLAIYCLTITDRLQYTITSRKEMPHGQFCAEIAKAAEDLYQLHLESASKTKL